MNNKILTPHDVAGDSVYALVLEGAEVWSLVGVDFETWVNANIDDYDIQMTELDTGCKIYAVDFPANIPPGTYTIIIRVGIPGVGDNPIAGISFVHWDGTKLAIDAGVMLAQSQSRRS